MPSGSSAAASDSRLAALSTRVDETLKALDNMGATRRDNAVKGTLEDEFDDRLALRSRIREEINANLLDDSHDVDGNSLYHLQFASTLMPGTGRAKAQYGIASLTIERVEMQPDEYDLLYHTWLASVTDRMNQDLVRIGDDNVPMNHAALGPLTGLYDVAELLLPRGEEESGQPSGGPQKLMIAVHPGMGPSFSIPDTDLRREQLVTIVAKMKEARDEKAQVQPCLLHLLKAQDLPPAAPENVCKDLLPAAAAENDNRLSTPKAVMDLARRLLELAPSVEVAVLALGDRSLVSDQVKRRGRSELDKFRAAFQASRELYGLLKKACAQRPDSGPCAEFDADAIIKEASRAPDGFGAALKKQQANIAVFPYSADPAMRVQRLSTVASAANALELAAGLAAQLPNSGAGASAGVGFTRRAAGRVDAMERVPEVIGFAGRKADDKDYEFGWVFGPRLSVDTNGNRLELRQQARTVPVSADISVPGWWTKAKLKVAVAWRGNFGGDGSLLDAAPVTSYELPVRFRLNRASYDALTVTLTRALTAQGYHQARIDNVRPEVLPLCKDTTNPKVTLLIYGVDLWRNPRVFLGGTAVPQEGISVLPDMTGLSATVDTASLSKPALRADGTLVVWTNHGVAETKLHTQVSANCESAAGQPEALAQTTLSTTIERVSPGQISVCEDRVTFVVSGRGLGKDADLYRLGSRPASQVRTLEGKGKVTTFAVTFDGLRKANPGIDKLALSFVGHDGVVNMPVTVAPAKCEKAPEPTYTFQAGVDRLVTTDTVGKLRVRLSLPAGKRPAVSISISGGEIETAAAEPDAKRAKTQTATLRGGVVTLASSIDLKTESLPVAISLGLRNLRAGDSVVLTAKPPAGDGTGDIALTIPVVAAAH